MDNNRSINTVLDCEIKEKLATEPQRAQRINMNNKFEPRKNTEELLIKKRIGSQGCEFRNLRALRGEKYFQSIPCFQWLILICT